MKYIYILLIMKAFIQQESESDSEKEIPINTCSIGCIYCKESKCLACDITNNYFLTKQKCEKQEITNCRLKLNERCLSCITQMFIDNNKCIEVQKTDKIDNCDFYSKINDKITCTNCIQHFYINELGKCVAVSEKIENCIRYSTDGNYCLDCNEKVPDFKFKSCLEKPENFDKCHKFQFLTCLECKENYYSEKNQYLKQIQKQQSSYLIALVQNFNQSGRIYSQSICNQQEIQNCVTLEGNSKCLLCKDNYFLDEKDKCEEFPQQRIDNCLIYKSKSVCQQCKQGFWLKDSTHCDLVQQISKCSSYSEKQSSKCLGCESDYYLQNNKCRERTVSKSIQFCTKQFYQLDLCEECQVKYVTNKDNSKCLEEIKHCKEYNKDIDKLVCTSCNDEYYLDQSQGKCFDGLKEGCLQYLDKDKCKQCQQQYYLKEQQCVKHELLEYFSCLSFSSAKQNYCDKCLSTSIKFKVNNTCIESKQLVSNCINYLEDNKCQLCDSSNSYLLDSKCQPISINNCLEHDSVQARCVKCKPDGIKILIPTSGINNICKENNPNIYENCQQVEDTSLRNCLYCKEGYYQFLMKSNVFQYCVPFDYYLFDSLSKKQDCVLFDQINNKCLQCKQNEAGHTLVISDGKCIKDCPATHSISTYNLKPDNKNLLNKFQCNLNNFFQTNFTIKSTIQCKRYDFNYYEKLQQLCMQCHDNYIGYYKMMTIDSNFKYQYSNYSYLFSDFKSSFSKYNRVSFYFSCLSKNVGNNTTATETLLLPSESEVSLDNCKTVSSIILLTKEYYFCIACNHGHQGIISKGNLNDSPYFISKCNLMSTCEKETWINGLGGIKIDTKHQQHKDIFPFPFDNLVSCHRCKVNSPTDKKVIPTFGVVLDSDNANQFINYQIAIFGFPTTDIKPIETTTTVFQTTCSTPGLGKVFIENCGIQMLVVNKKLKDYQNINSKFSLLDITNPLCIACSPKYKPTMSQINKYAIDDCKLIEHCVQSNEFNRCEECEEGHALDSTSDGTSCLVNKIEKCLIVTGNACTKCEKGYVLNVDERCDLITLNNCVQVGHFQEDLVQEDILHQNYEGYGCQKCGDESIGLIFVEKLKMCIEQKQLLTDSIQNTQTTKPTDVYEFKDFIKHCKFYELSSVGQLICFECIKDYILQSDKKKCWAVSSLENCKIAQIGGKTCKQCIDLYYFDTAVSSCVKGPIQNCKQYENLNHCEECEEFYVKTLKKGNSTVCFDTRGTKCLKYDIGRSLFGTLECEQCEQNYYLNQELLGFPLIQCIRIPLIQNCQTYDQSSEVTKSVLTCLICKEGFYVNSGNCSERTKKVDNCSVYQNQANDCEQCNQGYYLEESKQCKLNPEATPGCINFSSSTNCIKCDKDMYIDNNLCFEVKKLILNCQFYRNETECLSCESNYFLFNNQCEQSLAKNCLELENIFKCKKCEGGFGLVTSGQIVNCIKIEVTNCSITDDQSDSSDFKCLKCSVGYYLNSEGKCINAKSSINSCVHYKEQFKCNQCESGLILNDDQQKCLDLKYLSQELDSNCINHQLKYQCSLCEKGHIYDESRNCVACPQNVGCFACNPIDINQCLVCSEGYYQKEEGKCIKEIQETVVVQETKDGISLLLTTILLLFQINQKLLQKS